MSKPAYATFWRGALTGLGVSCATSAMALAQAAPQQPNIVLIVADDLGYSDIGAFGGEIPTPNLDALIADGVQLTNFHVAPTCSPTRSMLLTGTDNHVAGLGNMAEEMLPRQRGLKGYEGFLNDDVVTFPTLLRDGGYQTYMAGKWHLGAAEPQRPGKRGFDQSFALLGAGAHQFDQTGFVSMEPKALYTRNDEPIDLPEDFGYTTDYFTSQLIAEIDGGAKDKPFFAYLAYNAPHWPLQAPDDSIALFRGKYDAGYDSIQTARLERMKKLGLIEPMSSPAGLPDRWPHWDELNDQQRAEEARKMEVYAAMVYRMDENIGRLVDYLHKADEYDDTIFIFMSDNGAEGGLPEDIMGGRDRGWIEANFDNSLDNLGRRGSYFGYGPSWAAVSQTPFRMVKGYTYEGGTRSPAFITYAGWPGGRKSDAFMQVKDIAPTLLELAGVDHPADYDGRPIAPLEGMSLAQAMEQGGDPQRANEALCTELFGRVAVWKGDHKLVYSNRPWGTGDWELFDIKSDPTETKDLSGAEPAKVQELADEWESCKSRYNILWDKSLADEMVYSNKQEYLFTPSRVATTKEAGTPTH